MAELKPDQEAKWNPVLKCWMVRKYHYLDNKFVPLTRDKKPVWALPGGGEYVG